MSNFNVFLLFMIFIAVNLPEGENVTYHCQTGYELHGKKCYIALGLNASWPEAKEYCKIIGGNLANITSEDEQTSITKIMTNMHGKINNRVYWLDGSNMLDEKQWRWMGDHGESVPFNYTNWAPGQPDLAKKHCLVIRDDCRYEWYSAPCNYSRSFICEASAKYTEVEIVNDIFSGSLKFKKRYEITNMDIL